MYKNISLRRWAIALSIVATSAAAVYAEFLGPIDFEAYATGTVNGQDGWVSLGSAGLGCAVYDHAVVYNIGAPASFGTQSLRISNAATSGCFGDQTFSKPLVNEAGETTASNNGLSGGVRQRHFDVLLDLASMVPGAVQPGLHLSMSPDRGDGARMSYLRVEDNAGGIDVFFDDVQQPGPCLFAGCANFVETQVASSLDRTKTHSLGLSMDFYDGPNNDVVRVFIDGVLVHTGTSWEGYYAFDLESADGFPSRTVDSLLIRTSGAAAPGTFLKGFLIDNIRSKSSPILTKDQCKNGGWQSQVNPSFKNQGQCVSFVETGK